MKKINLILLMVFGLPLGCIHSSVREVMKAKEVKISKNVAIEIALQNDLTIRGRVESLSTELKGMVWHITYKRDRHLFNKSEQVNEVDVFYEIDAFDGKIIRSSTAGF